MELLLVHQNFPGQFRELAPAWLARGYAVTAIGCSSPKELHGSCWQTLRYHPYRCRAHQWRNKVLADHLRHLMSTTQLAPDLVIVHAGWGEASVIKAIWPDLPVVVYPELWGSARALGVGFDDRRSPLTPTEQVDIDRQNTITAHAMARADALVVPTAFQRDGFPAPWPERITCIHEGVALDRLQPDPRASLLLPNGELLDRCNRVITYVSRQFEPLRGLHTFMAALPPLLQCHPDLQVVMVGGLGIGYGTDQQHPGGHLAEELERLPADMDLSRLHWVGQLSHAELTCLLQISSAHVYLTYPYTLSWSVLEAMACGAPVVSNHGGPVEELIRDGESGLLIDFNSPGQLSAALQRLINNPELQKALGQAGRKIVERQFSLNAALERYDQLFNDLLTAPDR